MAGLDDISEAIGFLRGEVKGLRQSFQTQCETVNKGLDRFQQGIDGLGKRLSQHCENTEIHNQACGPASKDRKVKVAILRYRTEIFVTIIIAAVAILDRVLG